jgi:hypothetical protein
MKMKLLLLLFVLLVPAVLAEVECSNVFVVKFNYDNGIVNYGDRVIKCGYAPDRKVQPIEGYTAEMISVNDDILYSFKFNIPLKLNIDLSDPIMKSLSGGMVILNETDFALIFPYYDDAKSIVIYNPRQYDVLEIPLMEEQFIQEKTSLWFLVLMVVVLVVAYLIYKKNKTTKNSREN